MVCVLLFVFSFAVDEVTELVGDRSLHGYLHTIYNTYAVSVQRIVQIYLTPIAVHGERENGMCVERIMVVQRCEYQWHAGERIPYILHERFVIGNGVHTQRRREGLIAVVVKTGSDTERIFAETVSSLCVFLFSESEVCFLHAPIGLVGGSDIEPLCADCLTVERPARHRSHDITAVDNLSVSGDGNQCARCEFDWQGPGGRLRSVRNQTYSAHRCDKELAGTGNGLHGVVVAVNQVICRKVVCPFFVLQHVRVGYA